jgi:16S rRNA (cytidine1402-2'-O)-methyltransferase
MTTPKIRAKSKSASGDITRSRVAAQPAAAATVRVIAPGTLHLVPLPIGNLQDITLRALDVLKSVHTIAAEDTRNTGKLLKHFVIKTRLVACHDHNEQVMAPKIIAQLQSGQDVALVSDAGTPLVSDPGYRIVAAAIAAGLSITALPGANAVLPAVQLSGLPPHPFYFNGFLPTRSAARQRHLRSLAQLAATLVFYEAPHRVHEMLEDAEKVFGKARAAAVVREISKKFEETKRGTLHQLREFYSRHPARGEVVVVIGGQTEELKWDEAQVQDALAAALKSGATFRDAVALVATESAWPKKEVYDAALALKANA